MISMRLIKNLTNTEIDECNNLIDFNFNNNRFNDYTNVIIYIINNKIIGFIGIYDNLLNQLCTDIEYRRMGIASKLLDTCKKILKKPMSLFIDKNKESTEYLLNFYLKREFKIEFENDIEYKMTFK